MTPSRIPPTRIGSNGQDHRPSDETRTDEIRLFERMARRDAGALTELYARFSGPIYSFALRTLGSREEAEEVLQDTFVRLWDRAGTYDASLGRPFTWAFVLARGLCLDRLRRAARRARLVRLAPFSEDGTSAGAVRAQPDAFSKDDLRAVVAALDSLPASERRAVEMAVFLEYTGAEIASNLDEPLGTVKSRIRRGLARMRQHLKRHDRS
jgi:RNA polymerase sigma-70 factor (ECF subfamily)